MPINKASISPPLEAGPSLSLHLPHQVHSALEYVSSRLVRRNLAISLLVLRVDDHALIPRPSKYPISGSFSPSSSRSPSSSPKSFKRSTSKASLRSLSSSASSVISLSKTNWLSLPASPTPFRTNTPAPPNRYGISLMYAGSLTAKAERILQQAITRAENKFKIGSSCLPAQLSSTLTNDLIHRSLLQNEVLFSSKGLKLLSVDHVYSFKCRLNTYSHTLATSDFTSAVDELRRLVLAQHGHQIAEAYFMQAYAWLGVSLAVLLDVNERYKIRYGGPRRFGGIELQSRIRRLPPSMTSLQLKAGQRLKLQTTFEDCVSDMIEHGEDSGPHYRGPSTPSKGNDFTPVTRGEWSSLLSDSGWSIKTAAIHSC